MISVRDVLKFSRKKKKNSTLEFVCSVRPTFVIVIAGYQSLAYSHLLTYLRSLIECELCVLSANLMRFSAANCLFIYVHDYTSIQLKSFI